MGLTMHSTTLLLVNLLTFLPAAEPSLPEWALGPFTRPVDAQPVIRPNPDSVFDCPLTGKPVNWEKLHTFNPAAVVKDGKIHVLYRAEDDSGRLAIGGHTSRIGLAISADGLTFARQPLPVYYADDDDQKPFEWPGGTEDPRIAESPEGTCILTFTQYFSNAKGHGWRIGLASSKDLVHWTKHGAAFSGTPFENRQIKSSAVVHEVKDGRLIATRINGKFWMYFGESGVHLATSEDFIHWTPVTTPDGQPQRVLAPRNGFFDSALTEVGCQAVRTAKGIVLIYNGKNRDPLKDGDPELSTGVYTCGQALFDANDPTKFISRLDKPFFKPELSWEKSGQYKEGTTFAEGLVLFNGKWLLYYGCADTFVGVASAAVTP